MSDFGKVLKMIEVSPSEGTLGRGRGWIEPMPFGIEAPYDLTLLPSLFPLHYPFWLFHFW